MRYPDELSICITLKTAKEANRIEKIFTKRRKTELKTNYYRRNSGVIYEVKSAKGPTWYNEFVIDIIRSDKVTDFNGHKNR